MFKEKLQPFIDRYDEISTLLSAPDIASDIKRMTDLGREQSALSVLVEKAQEERKKLTMSSMSIKG